MITRCLNEKEEYYRYDDLRKATGSEREFRYASLIFRLVCRMTPKMAIFADSSVRNICVKAVKMADSRIVCEKDFPDRHVTKSRDEKPGETAKPSNKRSIESTKLSNNKPTENKTIVTFNGANCQTEETLASKLLAHYQNIPSTSREVTLAIVIPRPYSTHGKSILASLSPITDRSQQFISPRAAIICYPHPTPEKYLLTF